MKKNLFLQSDLSKIRRKIEIQIRNYVIAIIILLLFVIIFIILGGIFKLNLFGKELVYLFIIPLLIGLLSSLVLTVFLILWNKENIESRYQELTDIQKNDFISPNLKSHYDFDRLNIYSIIDRLDFGEDIINQDISNDMDTTQGEIVQEILTSKTLIIINPIVTPLVEKIVDTRKEKSNLKTNLITCKTALGLEERDVLKKHIFYKEFFSREINIIEKFSLIERYKNFSLNFSMITDKYIIYSFFPNSYIQSHNFPLIIMEKGNQKDEN